MKHWAIFALLVLYSAAEASIGFASSHSNRFTILCYNIQHGRGMDGVLDLERIAKVIERSGADIVLLQEVDERAERSGGVSQVEELGRLTEMTFARFARAIDFQGGYYGLAALAREPFHIVDTAIDPIPGANGREQRIIQSLLAEWSVGDDETRSLLFLNTHLDHTASDDNYRLAALPVVDEVLSRHEGVPVIFAGDLNSRPDSTLVETLSETWGDADGGRDLNTFPADGARIRIDYILYRPMEDWRVIEYEVMDEPVASDHLPLRAVFEYTPSTQ